MNEAIKMANELNVKSINLLRENKEPLEKIANALIENETLTGEEVRQIAGKQFI